jgi:hypothetical protein
VVKAFTRSDGRMCSAWDSSSADILLGGAGQTGASRALRATADMLQYSTSIGKSTRSKQLWSKPCLDGRMCSVWDSSSADMSAWGSGSNWGQPGSAGNSRHVAAFELLASQHTADSCGQSLHSQMAECVVHGIAAVLTCVLGERVKMRPAGPCRQQQTCSSV